MVREHGPCFLDHLITPKLCSQLFCHLVHLWDSEVFFREQGMECLQHLRINGICLRPVPQHFCEVRTLLGVHFINLDLMLCSKCTQIVGIRSSGFIDEPYCLVPLPSIPLLEELLQGLQPLLIRNFLLMYPIPELQRLL